MRTRVLRRPIVFQRVRCSICICCSIPIYLIKTVRCSTEKARQTLGGVEFYTINKPGTHIHVYHPAQTPRPALGPNQTPIQLTAVAITTKVKAVGQRN